LIPILPQAGGDKKNHNTLILSRLWLLIRGSPANSWITRDISGMKKDGAFNITPSQDTPQK
jgi:hypothetical protein